VEMGVARKTGEIVRGEAGLRRKSEHAVSMRSRPQPDKS
jgi:hypothetical protein